MLSLSDIVIDWVESKSWPIVHYAASASEGIWWLDLEMTKEQRRAGTSHYGPLLVIDDNGIPPYVVAVDDRRRPMKFFNSADPEFFEQLEAEVNERIRNVAEE